MADGLLEVRRFDCKKSQNVIVKDVAIKIFDIMALSVHSGNRKSVIFSTRLRKIQQPMPLDRVVVVLNYTICYEMTILDMSLLIQNERCPVQSRI
jgi:hypothetical protein